MLSIPRPFPSSLLARVALASRLSEERPAALYTDLEHARLIWLTRDERGRDRRRVKGHWGARKLVEPPKTDVGACGEAFRVVDSCAGSWLTKWDRYFRNLNIVNLRSPLFFHPSPSDTEGLLAYVQSQGKEGECLAIHGVVGQELSKHAKKKLGYQSARRKPLINERDRSDYFRPSTSTFRQFCCDEMEQRYRLEKGVEAFEVTSIAYNPFHLSNEGTTSRFVVEGRRQDGTTEHIEARAVVLATGAPDTLNFPPSIEKALPSVSRGQVSGEGWCHSAAFASTEFSFPPLDVGGNDTTMCVIGGGLTSAQICDLAIVRGVSKVVLLCRGGLKVKHFDFDLSWVTKYANLEKMAFYREESFDERLRIFKAARNGGSIDPAFHKILKKHINTGQLNLQTFTQVRRAAFDVATRKWSFQLERTGPSFSSAHDTSDLSNIDYLVLATGSTPAFDQIPSLQNLLTSHPINTTGGLPNLTQDLQWSEEVPLFVMGAYSALQLGPDAPNLAGTRSAAERICRRIDELNILGKASPSAKASSAFKWRNGSEGNYFQGLEQEVE